MLPASCCPVGPTPTRVVVNGFVHKGRHKARPATTTTTTAAATTTTTPGPRQASTGCLHNSPQSAHNPRSAHTQVTVVLAGSCRVCSKRQREALDVAARPKDLHAHIFHCTLCRRLTHLRACRSCTTHPLIGKHAGLLVLALLPQVSHQLRPR